MKHPDKGHLISIVLKPHYGADTPKQASHFGASPAFISPMKVEGFVGDTNLGGSCNAFELTINPHTSGTHTETQWHFGGKKIPPIEAVKKSAYVAVLITLDPASDISGESYPVPTSKGDLFLTKDMLSVKLETYLKTVSPEALVIRTLPNPPEKKTTSWNQDVVSPYLTMECASYIKNLGIKHFVADFPSVDKNEDGGKLAVHRILLDGRDHTVTEMAYIDNAVCDGIYDLSIEVPPICLDAVPSALYLRTPAKP